LASGKICLKRNLYKNDFMTIMGKKYLSVLVVKAQAKYKIVSSFVLLLLLPAQAY